MVEPELVAKRARPDDSVVTMHLKYQNRDFHSNNPKMYLNLYCHKMGNAKGATYITTPMPDNPKFYTSQCMYVCMCALLICNWRFM